MSITRSGNSANDVRPILVLAAAFLGSAIGSSIVQLFASQFLVSHESPAQRTSSDTAEQQTCSKTIGKNDKTDNPETDQSFRKIFPDISFDEEEISPYNYEMLAEAFRQNVLVDGSGIITVGIAGGTGSGKTTLAMAIYKALGENSVTYLSHDNYYKDLSHLSMEEREVHNFDHPHSLDTNLLVNHIKSLKEGLTIEVPSYDFSTHSRITKTTLTTPTRVILLEGILIFSEPKLVDQLDVKIFVDTESDTRLMRRIGRDTKKRGRTLDQVLDQYTKTVRPMHIEFVEPSKKFADVIIPLGVNPVALSLIVDHLSNILDKED
mmetsp:Transcript_31939/g.63260  ORF Transcript_31939/g.63260 Transcript_31939/m.63260 type:complete len:321 (+) Transcript_31939:80-1042(+)|eukprot:CAMPEP_0194341096 /NCGR_PEP_ID=MMETSP0171-20130528/88627_1 /TAXON_ID=218684 /ORGANISM="Corethron pennatum, Strain L29A3" /LENGTH=320 /DNA_ID=CAMNT_0039106313 /DNA_START=40 /DNA_END=1002 /DNA_ORIENTATION=+